MIVAMEPSTGEPFRDFACYRALNLSTFGSFFSSTTTTALSSKDIRIPLGLAHLLFSARITTARTTLRRMSGVPFWTLTWQVPQPDLGLTAPDTVVTKDRNYLLRS